MYKKNILTLLLAVAVLAAGLSAWNVTPAAAQAPVASSPSLSAADQAALTYMREEEKLAHDVYQALYDQWGQPVFRNIAASELTHTNMIKALLVKYAVPDPASPEPGVFTNPELQKLYTDLVALGGGSLIDALKVGAAIEEIDILDLQERLATTTNADIKLVFGNLLRGSTNHLRSYARLVEMQTGASYQPQYLTPEAYQAPFVSGRPGRYGNPGAGGRGGYGQP